MLLRDLKEKIDKCNEDELDSPLMVMTDYFEKYPLIPITLSHSYSKGIGQYSSLKCKPSKDLSDVYSDLMIALKGFKLAEKSYKQSIIDYFHNEHNVSIFNIDLRFSDRYGDSLEFKVYNALSNDALLGFVEEFKYRLPSMRTQKISDNNMYTFYKFYKKTPRLEELLRV